MSAYLPWLESIFAGLDTATVKAMLLTDSYVVDLTDQYRADVTASEVTGTGYTAGGVAVTGLAVTRDDANGRLVVVLDDVSFGTIDVANIGAIVLYVDTGSSATDVLIGIDVFGTTSATGSDTYTYLVNTDGFMWVTA